MLSLLINATFWHGAADPILKIVANLKEVKLKSAILASPTSFA